MKNEIILISSKEELQSLEILLNEYGMHDLFTPTAFLNLGYKSISSSVKDTYRLLSDIQKLNRNHQIEISLDYLATALGTSEECQSERIRMLEKAQLIKVTRQAYSISKYTIISPLPDGSFVDTVQRLILRKRLGLAISKYHSLTNILDKTEALEEIKQLVNLGASHHRLSSIKHLLSN